MTRKHERKAYRDALRAIRDGLVHDPAEHARNVLNTQTLLRLGGEPVSVEQALESLGYDISENLGKRKSRLRTAIDGDTE